MRTQEFLVYPFFFAIFEVVRLRGQSREFSEDVLNSGGSCWDFGAVGVFIIPIWHGEPVGAT